MDIANLLNPASNPSPVQPASLTHRWSHRVAKPRLYLSKSKLCPSWLYLVMPAWPQDMNTVHGHGYQLTTLSGSTTVSLLNINFHSANNELGSSIPANR